MPQIVDVVGYGPVEFPDGMSKAEMEKALKLLPPKPAEPQPAARAPVAAPAQPAPSGPQRNVFASRETQYDPMTGVPLGLELPTQIGAATLAGAKGVLDPFAGAAQFFGFNAPARKLQEVGQAAKEIGGAPATGAEFVGQMASPLPIKGGAVGEKLVGALPGAAGKSVMARMGAQGAVQGALMPTTTPDLDYGEMLSEKLKQAGTGAAFGAAAGKATQMALAPQVSEKMQMLKDMGMKYFTPGQLMADLPLVGPSIQKAEQNLTSTPIVGSIIQRGLERTSEDFNRAIGNKILQPIGEKLPKDIKPGNEMNAYLADKVDDAYRGLENKISFQNLVNPKTNQSTMDFLLQKYTEQAAEKTIGNKRLILDEFKDALLDNLQRKGSLTGTEFRQAEKALGNKARTYMRNPETQDVGFALRNLQEALRNELVIQNPAVGRELRGIHEMFKRNLRAERASSYRGAEEGVFSPSQFRSAAETLAGRKATATGRGMFIPEAQAATSVLGKSVPDSGTAGRLMTPQAIQRATERGNLSGNLNLLTIGLPAATTGMLYNPLAMSLMTKMATSRPGALTQASPALEAAAARSAAISGGQ